MHHMYQQQHNKYIEFKAIKRPRHTFSLALGSAGARMAYFCLPQAALTHLKFLLHIWRCTSAEQQASLVQISWLSQLNLSKQCAIYRCGNTYGHCNSKFSTLYSNYGSRQNGCIHVHKISQYMYFSRSDAAIKPERKCVKLYLLNLIISILSKRYDVEKYPIQNMCADCTFSGWKKSPGWTKQWISVYRRTSCPNLKLASDNFCRNVKSRWRGGGGWTEVTVEPINVETNVNLEKLTTANYPVLVQVLTVSCYAITQKLIVLLDTPASLEVLTDRWRNRCWLWITVANVSVTSQLHILKNNEFYLVAVTLLLWAGNTYGVTLEKALITKLCIKAAPPPTVVSHFNCLGWKATKTAGTGSSTVSTAFILWIA